MKDVKNIFDGDIEPTVRSGAVYLPMWLVGLLGFLLYGGCNYVDDHGRRYSGLVYEPYYDTNELTRLKPGGTDPTMDLGRGQCKQLCAPCRQERGIAAPKLSPTLARA